MKFQEFTLSLYLECRQTLPSSQELVPVAISFASPLLWFSISKL
jgi:hypothetical protein